MKYNDMKEKKRLFAVSVVGTDGITKFDIEMTKSEVKFMEKVATLYEGNNPYRCGIVIDKVLKGMTHYCDQYIRQGRDIVISGGSGGTEQRHQIPILNQNNNIMDKRLKNLKKRVSYLERMFKQMQDEAHKKEQEIFEKHLRQTDIDQM